MNAGLFGLAAYLAGRYRKKGISLSSVHAEASQVSGAAPLATQSDHIKQVIEARLAELLPHQADPDDALTAAMRSAVLGAGKRVRPMLFMAIVSDVGCDSPALPDLACAIEIVHAASLILDDLPCMDDAKLRRGHAAVHIQFGEDVAVLAAVALLSHAFNIVACADPVSPEARVRLTRVLAQAVGAQGLAKGQFQDLHGAYQKSVADIAMTYALKTGALLGLAVEMAAIVAQTGAEATQCLRQFASAAGMAFQIRDDLLDAGMASLLPTDEILGKDTGQDIGKATLPGAVGMEPARLRMASELRRADGQLQRVLGPNSQTRQLLAALFPHCCKPSS